VQAAPAGRDHSIVYTQWGRRAWNSPTASIST
jgi:hypothetical protein